MSCVEKERETSKIKTIVSAFEIGVAENFGLFYLMFCHHSCCCVIINCLLPIYLMENKKHAEINAKRKSHTIDIVTCFITLALIAYTFASVRRKVSVFTPQNRMITTTTIFCLQKNVYLKFLLNLLIFFFRRFHLMMKFFDP